VLMAIGMLMMGIQIGLTGIRQAGLELALAISFSVVLFLIADLDRPQEGLINVSQQAMVELQLKLNAR
jgi:galactitol-specific phosphotransferase system IIC component